MNYSMYKKRLVMLKIQLKFQCYCLIYWNDNMYYYFHESWIRYWFLLYSGSIWRIIRAAKSFSFFLFYLLHQKQYPSSNLSSVYDYYCFSYWNLILCHLYDGNFNIIIPIGYCWKFEVSTKRSYKTEIY